MARNIAALPDDVIAAAKHAIVPTDHTDGLVRESAAWSGLVFRPATARLMGAALAHRAQTRAGEPDLEGLFRGLPG